MQRLILPIILTCAAFLSGCNGPSRAEINLAARMNALAAKTNRQAHLTFDPERDVLIADFAPDLIRNYRILTAVQSNESSFASPGYTTHRMVKYPDCKLENDNGWAAGASIKAISGDRQICWLQTRYEPAPQRAVVATTRHRKFMIDGVKTIEQRITIRRPDGATASFRVGITRCRWADVRSTTESGRLAPDPEGHLPKVAYGQK